MHSTRFALGNQGLAIDFDETITIDTGTGCSDAGQRPSSYVGYRFGDIDDAGIAYYVAVSGYNSGPTTSSYQLAIVPTLSVHSRN